MGRCNCRRGGKVVDASQQAATASLIAEVAAKRDAMPPDNPVGRYGVAQMVVEMEREARLAVAYSAAAVDACVAPTLRPACHQLLAAPGDDGPALAAKLSAIDFGCTNHVLPRAAA
jgi:hypothetical protein